MEDFEILDQPEILSFLFYPRRDDIHIPDDESMMSLVIPVEAGISVSCMFYISGKDDPSVLFFHGNGELASEYMDIGATFNRIGINLFVADYRGYGGSGGQPSISSMIKDTQPLYAGFKQTLNENGFHGSRFIMGRSLGSLSAIELAGSYGGEFKGLIIESGFCDITDLVRQIGIPLDPRNLPGDNGHSYGLDRVRQISIPALIIHGGNDSIVPLEEGEKIYANIGSKDKKMVVIPDADHNTIFLVGMGQYLQELRDFIKKNK
ncbi:MAG: alpha/beta hydrolase [Dehalococcoidia bacterium]|nr:alpha/beta hydrolase [Dehalococcoidia bacterium]MDD5493591.1 alpha/beta hydrolase [Dehalococcoidia bacterium]